MGLTLVNYKREWHCASPVLCVDTRDLHQDMETLVQISLG